jgi:dsDNA-specific endonuclease/ATPase MutS2
MDASASVLCFARMPVDPPSDPFDEPVHIPIGDVFDLHSVPARDVAAVVEEYLAEANRLGFKALRIIHGRGIGVQREIVRGILQRAPFVASFGDAPADAGGWGATVVTLK